MVGSFVFLGSFGPIVMRPGQGLDTRPHPHIGLSTVTYLIAGEVNLMTAGRGIVHSERSGDESRARTETMFGFQAWLALPTDKEEIAPPGERLVASSRNEKLARA
jgi:redox-sensitive bicupin YhaK (pirin superfamily)